MKITRLELALTRAFDAGIIGAGDIQPILGACEYIHDHMPGSYVKDYGLAAKAIIGELFTETDVRPQDKYKWWYVVAYCQEIVWGEGSSAQEVVLKALNEYDQTKTTFKQIADPKYTSYKARRKIVDTLIKEHKARTGYYIDSYDVSSCGIKPYRAKTNV